MSARLPLLALLLGLTVQAAKDVREVLRATALRLPSDPEGQDPWAGGRVEVCWSAPGADPTLAVRVYAGSLDEPMSAWEPVAGPLLGRSCWRGPWEPDRAWAVAPVRDGVEGERALARGTALRARSRVPVEARLEGDQVTAIAEGGGRLWFATDGGGLSAAPLSGDLAPWEAPWTTWRQADGPGADRLGAVLYEAAASRVWVGARGRVAALNLQDGTWRAYGVRDGLPEGLITTLLVPELGSVVAAAEGGQIVQFDPRSERWVTLAELETQDPGARVLGADGDGRFWISTSEGLRSFNPRDDRWARLACPGRVTAMLHDAAGQLWFGTEDAGLMVVREGRCEPVSAPPDGAWPAIRALLDGERGPLVGADRGLLRWVSAEGRWESGASDPSLAGLAGLPITGLHRDERGALWVAVRHEGLRRVDPDGAVSAARPASVLRAGPVGVVITTNGQVWFGSEGGISRLTLGTGAWSWWRSPSVGVTGGVSALAVGGAGELQTLWAGGQGAVARFLPTMERWDSFALPRPESRVLSILVDEPALWVGTDAGLLRFDLASGAWDEPFRGGWLERARVQALLRDSAGGLWVGTPQGALRLEASEGLELLPAGGALSGLDVAAIEQDGSGALWFSSTRGDLVQLLPASGDTRRVQLDPGDAITGMALNYDRLWFASERGLSVRESARFDGGLQQRVEARGTRGVAVDSGGRVWLATARGALRWDPETGISRRYPAALGEPEDEARVRASVTAGGGRVWLGTEAGSVLLVDAQGVVRDRLDGEDGLPGAPVRALYWDEVGELWIGTEGGGLVRVKVAASGVGAPEAMQIYRAADGLGSDQVLALTSRVSGELSVLTDRGAVLFEKASGFRPLSLPSGLRGALRSFAWRGLDELWVGTGEAVGWRVQPSGQAPIRVREPAPGASWATGVNVFFKDQDGNLWLGLEGGGLGRKGEQGVEPVTVDGAGPGLEVRAIREAAGRIWLATNQGAFWRPVGSPQGYEQTNAPLDTQGLPERRWTRADALDLGPGTQEIWDLSPDASEGMWFATDAGALRLDLGVGTALRVDPAAPPQAGPALLSGEPVGVALRGVAAFVRGDRLLGEPSAPGAVRAAVSACGESDLLLDNGEILRVLGQGLSREVVHAPLATPRALAVLCSEGALSGASSLCVGGDGLWCRGMAGQWTALSLPLQDPGAAITALYAHGAELWAGHEDGEVCRAATGAASSVACVTPTPSLGPVRALVEDGAGGVWVGGDRGLGRLVLGATGELTVVEPPRPLRAQGDGELQSGMSLDLAGAAVSGLDFDRATGTLWVTMPDRGVVRVGQPARRSFFRKAVSPVERTEPAPSLGGSERLEGVVVDAASRVWVSEGGGLYELDGRAPPTSTMWVLTLAIGGGLTVFALVWGSIHFSPVVRGWRRDPSSVERVGLDNLAPALRVLRLYAPGFARASIGFTRLGALERLARVWGGAPERVLPAAAEVLGLEPEGEIKEASLQVQLSLGLALKRRDTLLVLLPQEGDPDAFLRERLEARAFHELTPALAIWPGDEPPFLHGAVSLTEADLRAVGWSRQPKRALAGLVWQRSDMQGLSPYQAHGAVQDPRMFFGRDAVLRELTAAGRRRALLVIGPRRVGKTSVLLRAAAELERRGARTVYVTLRATVAGPYDLAVALARAARLPLPDPPSEESSGAEAAGLGAWIRANLSGANLLLDEADAFLRNDRARGSQTSEELRSLIQEGVCALALAGYGTLYRAALSQAETAYNLGEPLFLGSLEREAALRLATEPMERVGIQWADPELAERLVATLGMLPHLIQEACRRLLLRVRGFREPVLNSADLYAVLGDWRPEGEPSSLRELLVINVETNLKGPAQAAVWLLADELSVGFSLSELGDALHGAGFVDLDTERVLEIGLALQVAGVCQRGADHHRFLVPLLGEAVSHLDVGYRVAGLRDAWKAMEPGARRGFKFWGGEGEG